MCSCSKNDPFINSSIFGNDDATLLICNNSECLFVPSCHWAHDKSKQHLGNYSNVRPIERLIDCGWACAGEFEYNSQSARGQFLDTRWADACVRRRRTAEQQLVIVVVNLLSSRMRRRIMGVMWPPGPAALRRFNLLLPWRSVSPLGNFSHAVRRDNDTNRIKTLSQYIYMSDLHFHDASVARTEFILHRCPHIPRTWSRFWPRTMVPVTAGPEFGARSYLKLAVGIVENFKIEVMV